MLHIATPHVGSDAWIELQLEHYRRHTTEPYRTYAVVDHLDGREEPFDQAEATTDAGRRRAGPTFNQLAAMVCAEAADEDVVVFTHGDAWPIRDGWNEQIRAWLAECPGAGCGAAPSTGCTRSDSSSTRA